MTTPSIEDINELLAGLDTIEENPEEYDKLDSEDTEDPALD